MSGTNYTLANWQEANWQKLQRACHIIMAHDACYYAPENCVGLQGLREALKAFEEKPKPKNEVEVTLTLPELFEYRRHLILAFEERIANLEQHSHRVQATDPGPRTGGPIL